MSGRIFLGWTSTSKDKYVLLKDTTQWRRWGSNPKPLHLESSTLEKIYVNEPLGGTYQILMSLGSDIG